MTKVYIPEVTIYDPLNVDHDHHRLAVFASKGTAEEAARNYARVFERKGYKTGVSVAECEVWEEMPECYTRKGLAHNPGWTAFDHWKHWALKLRIEGLRTRLKMMEEAE